LRQEIRHTLVLLFGSPSELKGDAALNFQRWRESGGETLVIENEEGLRSAWPGIATADFILDALLGTGLRGAATGLIAEAISDLNSLSRNATSAGPALIVAVDIPSGMASDGEPSEGAVLRAHDTVTLTAPKIGQLISNDASSCGNLNVRAIGTPPVLIDELGKGNLRCAGPDEFAKLPLIRPADSNKGLYGHILVIADRPANPSGRAGRNGRAESRSRPCDRRYTRHRAIIVASNQPEYMTEPLPTLADGSIAIENLADAAFAKSLKARQFSPSDDWDRSQAHRNLFERWCNPQRCPRFSMPTASTLSTKRRCSARTEITISRNYTAPRRDGAPARDHGRKRFRKIAFGSPPNPQNVGTRMCS
jgi:NAD(P)H-hydrate epimerase